jgi:hypothetical protein
LEVARQFICQALVKKLPLIKLLRIHSLLTNRLLHVWSIFSRLWLQLVADIVTFPGAALSHKRLSLS